MKKLLKKYFLMLTLVGAMLCQGVEAQAEEVDTKEEIEETEKPEENEKVQIDLNIDKTEYYLGEPVTFHCVDAVSGVYVVSVTHNGNIQKEEMEIQEEFSKAFTQPGTYEIVILDANTEEAMGKSVTFTVLGHEGNWRYRNGKWQYEKWDGSYYSNGFYSVDGEIYYFDAEAYMRTGWVLVEDTWYLFAKSGEMLTGWQYDGGTWYYMNEDGKMLTGWLEVDGHTYYLADWGGMRKGWQFLGDTWYLFAKSGEMLTGWQYVGGTWYFMDKEGKMLTGWQYVGGYWYYMEDWGGMKTGWLKDNGEWYYLSSSGAMVKGWNYVGNWKYYFTSSGEMCDDLRGMVSGPYHIKVNKQKDCVTVYAKDGSNGYTIPVVAFICSDGVGTPTGTFYTPAKYRWHTLMGPSYGQWCTRIYKGILFHSVFYNSYNNNMSLAVGEYNKLGQTASHGCIRLTAGDAKWIYDNCELGTKVTIYNSSYVGPFDKPTAYKLPASHRWDPTDPIAYAKCQQLGCH